MSGGKYYRRRRTAGPPCPYVKATAYAGIDLVIKDASQAAKDIAARRKCRVSSQYR